ncbi:hypothetical protein BJY52DRAFT_1421484 [Lactarius psammicola]|nr:hypothetical protein BJY52DRAFT_1421484 [Lactarius psammicola]
MQLHHAQRQLLSRCSLRYYSASAVSGDAVAASGTSVPPRLRRPSASSFGGISIQNVAVPTQSQDSRSRTNQPSRADGSDHKSSNTPRTNQQERHRGAGRHAMSGWGDGLVSFSFSNRLRMHHEKMTKQDTTARPEAQERRQQSKPRQHTQMQGRQQEQGARPHAPRTRDPQNSPSAGQTRRPTSVDTRPRVASMTRSPASHLNIHAQSKPTSTSAPSNTAKDAPASINITAADRAARLTALSSTNLNALFRTRDTPVAGTPLPAYASTTARVRNVLERSAGDYSRFLSRRVGVRKSASRPPALRTARHALAAQRDVSLAQRRIALHIIGGLAQPHRQVSA